ncbi:MAG TPA: ABC transporter ATP-binding protein [Chitinophagaceae bacterium]|jgi:lipopolysaccharide transport system ATP-binding protein|nr:ABC transporter ATP-binding protein [Chitinophagaceae bacterium]
MNNAIITVKGLGKKYSIAHERGANYTALRDVISTKAKQLIKKNDLPPKEEFWALKDVDFEVKKGEVVGIIGRNGAGKSTLLKILSRITEPTAGRIEINGRVASLLELGTGFHPELTGRENIFLNGAILGMSRTEVRKKFDEIVDFSGVEFFLDTPVKRYSSGMYIRLAFAVAAHLEPEILIIDEVLAVGDAEFQNKCLGKMKDVSTNEGRTVLLVSHNMASIKQLCNSGMILKNGSLQMCGAIDDVIARYLADFRTSANTAISERTDREGTQKIKYRDVIIRDEDLGPAIHLQNGSACYFELQLDHKSEATILKNVHFSVGINDPFGNRILLLSSYLSGQNFTISGNDISRVYLKIDQLPLKAGVYSYTLSCGSDEEVYDVVKFAGEFTVEEGDFFNTGKMLPAGQGYLMVKHSFHSSIQ